MAAFKGKVNNDILSADHGNDSLVTGYNNLLRKMILGPLYYYTRASRLMASSFLKIDMAIVHFLDRLARSWS